MHIVLRILINAAALWLAAVIVPGIHAGSLLAILATALVFGIVNALIRPVMKLVSCPIILLTLGLFTLVINALMLMLTSWLSGQLGLGFHVDGFGTALVGALIITIVSWGLDVLLPDDR